MKTTILLVLLFVTLSASNELFYYAGGEKIFLYTYNDKISVSWQQNITNKEKDNILQLKPGIKSWYDIEKYKVTILEVDETKSQILLEELLLLPQVEYANFILHTNQNDSIIVTNELIVKLKSSSSIEWIKNEYDVELLREDPYDETYMILKVLKCSQFNSLEIANKLTEEKRVVYACPNFIRRIEMHKEPGDNYYLSQWALPKIGVPLAWDYETGSSGIKIAIIDAGVDLGHPDLQNSIVTGYDVVDEDNIPQCNSWEAHGTCCAGIAAAITNNNNEGVAGIAGGWGSSGGCRIMPIRIGTPWQSEDDIKYCFEWATNHGAKILSNSWGYGGYHYSDPLHDGIKYAYNHGRLVCFSSGNINQDPYQHVHYPAADEFSMAVGATNKDDIRPNYSCYGHNLDIVAPSRRDNYAEGIYTTDNRGSGGYNTAGDYYSNFGGTSAACPHVAGLAGLLFSANSSLENFDVERIIKLAAQDLGASGWDEYYGYGRIDAANAVKHVVLPYELTKNNAASPILIASNVLRAFINRPRPEMPEAGTYYCDVYKVEQTVNFSIPYTEAPWGWFSFTGFSNANPNYCTEYLYHSSSTNSIILRTFFYQIKTGVHAGKWIPANPHSYATKVTILGPRSINSPTNLQATEVPNSNDIKLTWEDNAYNELKYKIFRSINGTAFYLYDSVGQNIQEYIDNNTTPYQQYWYRVQAWAQEFYSSYSNIDDATAGLHPPSDLYINPVVYSGVGLYWIDNTSAEDGFKIVKTIGNNVYTYTTGPNITSYHDDIIEPYYGQQVRYYVRAFKGSKNSSPSNEMIITPPSIFVDTVSAIDYQNCPRNLVKDNGDNYHLVLKHHKRLWYTKSIDSGQSWQLATYLHWKGHQPSIVTTSNGLPCFVYEEIIGSTHNLIYAYQDNQGSIHKTTLFSGAEYDLSPAIGITSTDVIFIGFVSIHSMPGEITCLSFNYDTPQYSVFNNFTTGRQAFEIRIAVDNQDNPHLVWRELYIIFQYTHWEVSRIIYGRYDGSKEEVHKGWATDQYPPPHVYRVGFPDIYTQSPDLVKFTWSVNRFYPSDGKNIWYRTRTTNPRDITLDPDIGNYPSLGRIVHNHVLCLSDNKIYAINPNRPAHAVELVTNVINYNAIPLGGALVPKVAMVYSAGSGGVPTYRIRFIIKSIPHIIPAYDLIYASPPNVEPEITGYNNSRRLLRDANGQLHLAFTSGENVYHTLLQDTTWSEPVLVGTGKYPSLSLGVDNKLHSIYAYNEGSPDFLEELRVSEFINDTWSTSDPLMRTYNSFLWGMGAPSFAINDSMAYFVFESTFGPRYHPEPGGLIPQVITIQGPALIYGKFPLTHPEDCQWQVLDRLYYETVIRIDTSIYKDSIVENLVSPSITLDLDEVVHILWEGLHDALYYYRIVDTVVTKELYPGTAIDFPYITMRGDQIDHFWCEQEVIKHRYAWTGTEALSETETIAECESPFSSGPYLTWTKQDGSLSHLYYGEIPGSGMIEPIEIDYSTNLIAYPQILYNPEKNNEPAAIDLVWTEYSYLDSLGYIYHLNLPIEEPAPTYTFDMGTETPVPVIVQRHGYLTLGPEDFQTFDYDSTELIYHMTLHSPHKKYKIRWTYYHEEPDKLKLQFTVDDILHHNRWVDPGEQVTEDKWIPQACLNDNEITIKVKRLKGTIAVLSGLEIEMHEVGGGGPQSAGVQPIKRFFFESMYPNPTKGVLKIRFNSPDERKVTVKMYDVVGRLAETIFNGEAKIGMNEFLIVPNELSAGIYFVRLETSGYEKTEKIILLQ